MTGRAAPVVTALAALLVLHLVLALPDHPRAMTPETFARLPLELPVILLALILAPRVLRLPLRLLLTGGLALMTVVKLADHAAFLAYARGFNPLLDLHLLPAAWNLGSGAIGTGPALVVVILLLLGILLLAAALWWATGRIAALAPSPALAPALGAALVAAVTLAATDALLPGPGALGTAFTTRLAFDHAARIAETRANLRRFDAEAADDPFAAAPADVLLAGLEDTDVILVFVESYGRSTLDHSRYARTIRPRLAAIAADLDAAGLAARSGWLTAPTIGGQSWLSHASLLSGLRIDNQRRYQALLSSARRTLMHYAADAGFRTVVIAPAITLAWPEAEYFGYGAIYPAAALGYRGKPFNWVTMPDQFTLRAFERLELERANRLPLLAEIALISSHAPWTPVPEPVPWEVIGDGTIFNAMATSGDPPETVWRDQDRVRDQFIATIDYSLATLGAFVLRHADRAPLVIILGDHEPAAFVAGSRSFEVPIHVIGPPGLVSRFAAWNFTEGLIPGPDLPTPGMEAFRDRFLATFSPGFTPGTAFAGGSTASAAP